MSEFKIGDKVKSPGGNTGTVEEINSKHIYPYRVSFQNSATINYAARELTLVESAPKFKVGDKVKIVGSYLMHNGEVAEVRSERDHGLFAVVFGKGPNTGSEFYTEEELTLVQPEPKFKVGDFVHVRASWRGTNGRAGIVSRAYESLGSAYYDLKFDDGHSMTGYLANELLKVVPPPVEEKEPEMEKLQAGDKVRVIVDAVVDRACNDGSFKIKPLDLGTSFGLCLDKEDLVSITEKAPPPRVPAPGEIWENNDGHKYIILADPEYCHSITPKGLIAGTSIHLVTRGCAKRFVR